MSGKKSVLNVWLNAMENDKGDGDGNTHHLVSLCTFIEMEKENVNTLAVQSEGQVANACMTNYMYWWMHHGEFDICSYIIGPFCKQYD